MPYTIFFCFCFCSSSLHILPCFLTLSCTRFVYLSAVFVHHSSLAKITFQKIYIYRTKFKTWHKFYHLWINLNDKYYIEHNKFPQWCDNCFMFMFMICFSIDYCDIILCNLLPLKKRSHIVMISKNGFYSFSLYLSFFYDCD